MGNKLTKMQFQTPLLQKKQEELFHGISYYEIRIIINDNDQYICPKDSILNLNNQNDDERFQYPEYPLKTGNYLFDDMIICEQTCLQFFDALNHHKLSLQTHLGWLIKNLIIDQDDNIIPNININYICKIIKGLYIANTKSYKNYQLLTIKSVDTDDINIDCILKNNTSSYERCYKWNMILQEDNSMLIETNKNIARFIPFYNDDRNNNNPIIIKWDDNDDIMIGAIIPIESIDIDLNNIYPIKDKSDNQDLTYIKTSYGEKYQTKIFYMRIKEIDNDERFWRYGENDKCGWGRNVYTHLLLHVKHNDNYKLKKNIIDIDIDKQYDNIDKQYNNIVNQYNNIGKVQLNHLKLIYQNIDKLIK